MTKGERKKAIAVALAKVESTGKALDEAHAQMREFERNDKTRYVADCFIMAAYAPYKQRIRECQEAYWEAVHEYNELTKYKAWKNL